MSANMKLGLDPGSLEITLTTGADFTSILRYRVAGVVTDWPAGTELSLVFADALATEWDATVTDEFAVFEVDKAAVTIADGTGARLRYVNGTTDRVLRLGKVNLRG